MNRTQPGALVRPRRSAEATSFSGRVVEVLEALTGRTVTVRLQLPRPTSDLYAADGGAVLARYVCADTSPDRFVIADLDTIARLGGARAMLSHGVVEQALGDEQWPDALLDNCYDVLAHCAEIFTRENREVRLDAVYGLLGSSDEDGQSGYDGDAVAAARRVIDEVLPHSPSRTLDADVTIAGYGTGRLAILRG